MALLFMDGFDHSGTSAASHYTKYGGTSSAALTNTPTRTGTGAAQFSAAGAYAETKPFVTSGAAIIGIARRWDSAFAASSNILEVYEGATLHMAVAIDSTGKLTVKRGATSLATGTTVLSPSSWCYIEFKTVIHATAGSYELRIDGVTELTASGINTRNGGTTGQWDRVRIVSGSGPAVFAYADDFYLADASGAAPYTDFLGVCKVETLLPQTGNGANAGLTPSTGTDHGALVDENPPNTTDYNSSATVGTKDTYNYPSLSLTGTILGLQTNLYAAKTDTGARTVCAVVRSGGADYDGASVSPLTTFSYLTECRALNPATGLAWTNSDIDALEAGMKVTA